MALPDRPQSAEPVPETEDVSLARALGINISYAPDELAPPVDRDQLAAFVRRELPAKERDEVRLLIAAYRSWRKAWAEALKEDAGR